jgi:hypothetical protein
MAFPLLVRAVGLSIENVDQGLEDAATFRLCLIAVALAILESLLWLCSRLSGPTLCMLEKRFNATVATCRPVQPMAGYSCHNYSRFSASAKSCGRPVASLFFFKFSRSIKFILIP